MTPIATCIAQAVMRAAAALAPHQRQDWSRAMQAEMQHVPDDNALSFALGCLWAAAKSRATTRMAIASAARLMLVLAAVAWSILHIRLAGLLWASGATTAAMLGYFAAIAIAGGAFFTAARGLRAVVILAAPVMVLAGLVAIGMDQFLNPSPLIHFYRAIAIEYIVILAMAIFVAIGAPRWAEQRERPAR